MALKRIKAKLKISSFYILLFLVFPTFSWAQKYCYEDNNGDGIENIMEYDDEKEIFNMNTALFPEGKILCKVSMRGSGYTFLRIEEGHLNGVKYRLYYSDASGIIQGLSTNTLDTIKDSSSDNWSIKCEQDGMDDSHWCQIRKKDLIVGIWKDGKTFIHIGHDHYPSSQVTIRIDKLASISANEKSGFSAQQTDIILNQLLKGSSALTRYQEWPYQSYIDQPLDLFGFFQAFSILQKVYESI